MPLGKLGNYLLGCGVGGLLGGSVCFFGGYVIGSEATYNEVLKGATVVPDLNSDCKPEVKAKGPDGRFQLWISTPKGLVPYEMYREHRAKQVGEKELWPLDRKVKKVLE